MTGDGKLTPHATSWAKHFRDDINSLKESDEGGDFVRELNGDVRKVFHLHAEESCADGLHQGQLKNVRRLPRNKHTKRTSADVGRKKERSARKFLKTTQQEWRMKCMPFFFGEEAHMD